MIPFRDPLKTDFQVPGPTLGLWLRKSTSITSHTKDARLGHWPLLSDTRREPRGLRADAHVQDLPRVAQAAPPRSPTGPQDGRAPPPTETTHHTRTLSCLQPHLAISPPQPRSADVAETARDGEQHGVRGGRTVRKRAAAAVTPEVKVQHRQQGLTRLSAQELAGECTQVRLGSRRGRSLLSLL